MHSPLIEKSMDIPKTRDFGPENSVLTAHLVRSDLAALVDSLVNASRWESFSELQLFWGRRYVSTLLFPYSLFCLPSFVFLPSLLLFPFTSALATPVFLKLIWPAAPFSV